MTEILALLTMLAMLESALEPLRSALLLTNAMLLEFATLPPESALIPKPPTELLASMETLALLSISAPEEFALD